MLFTCDFCNSCFYNKKKNLFLEPYFCITMPPKKAPLFCFVRGDPETSVFAVNYNEVQTFCELREVIEQKIETPGYVKAKDLILYQVDIDLTTQNPQRTALRNPNLNIVNDLGGQVLSSVDTIEEKFPRPANKHIHIIVNVPTLPAAGKRTLLPF